MCKGGNFAKKVGGMVYKGGCGGCLLVFLNKVVIEERERDLERELERESTTCGWWCITSVAS